MKIIIENLAKKGLDDIFHYNLQYSLKNAISTDFAITEHIKSLADTPYIGRYIPEISDKHFREIIYRKNRKSGYWIMYYIYDSKDIIRVFNIINCKQDFNHVLTIHNYFRNYFEI